MQSYANIFSVVAILSLSLVVGWLVLQPKGLPRCDSFSSYYDMFYFAKEKKARYLDINGDGNPCENTVYEDRPLKSLIIPMNSR